MRMTISIDGAREDDLSRAFEVACEAFRKAQMSPLEAAEGFHAREAWDIQGFPKGGIRRKDMVAAAA